MPDSKLEKGGRKETGRVQEKEEKKFKKKNEQWNVVLAADRGRQLDEELLSLTNFNAENDLAKSPRMESRVCKCVGDGPNLQSNKNQGKLTPLSRRGKTRGGVGGVRGGGSEP